MKIATYSKPSLRDNPAKQTLLKMLKAEKGFEVEEVLSPDDAADAERLLVFGGDGTMLHAAKHSPVPVLGVNLGNTGFLAELEADTDISHLTDALTNGKLLERFMLTANHAENSALALNEVTLKSDDARPIRVQLYIDGDYVDEYHSDGIIVSTPTGSTAYSLSAGGPVLAPELKAIVINPVCPHSLHSRPLVIDFSSKVELKLIDGSRANVIVDGDVLFQLPKDGILNVQKSPQYAKFVVVSGRNFYKKLLQKMNRWGTTR